MEKFGLKNKMRSLSRRECNNQNYPSVKKYGDILFCLAYAILLIRALLLVSTIKAYFAFDSFAYKFIPRLIAYSIILAKVCLTDKFSPKMLYIMMAFIILMLLSIYFNKYLSLMDILAIIIGSNGIPFRKIVRWFFNITALLCIAFIIFSLTGIIENYTTIRKDKLRYAFGNIYATDFAAMVFYLQLSNAYLRKKDYTILTVIFWVIISVLILKLCDARLDFILILSFSIVMYLKAKFPKLFRTKVIKFFLIYGFALSCVIALILHIVYTPNSSFLVFVNKLISGRLYYGNIVIKDYGFSLFGQNIEMQGWGWYSSWNSKLGYYFVDCGFLSVALRYGIVMLLIIVVSFCLVSKAEIKSGNIVLPIIILFIGVTSIVDQHFIELAYSPFVFVISYAISICSKSKHRKTYTYTHTRSTKKYVE